MSYGFQRDVVATLRFRLEQTLSINALTASGSIPVFLSNALIGQEVEKISTQVIVVVKRFVSIRPIRDKLIR